MKLSRIYLFLFLVLYSMSISNCTYDNEDDLFGESECGNLTQMSFQNDILPIFENNCFTCHDANTTTAGVSLVDYETVKLIAESGKLLGVIRHESGYVNMPPNSSGIDSCSILEIEVWIDEGAINN